MATTRTNRRTGVNGMMAAALAAAPLLLASTALADGDRRHGPDRGCEVGRRPVIVVPRDHDRHDRDRYHHDRDDSLRVRVSWGTPSVVTRTGRWVPGHYVTRTETVLVRPERCERVWVEPLYDTRYDDCGRPYRVLVRDGYWREVTVPARYETRHVEVWVPGRWEECGPVIYTTPSRPRISVEGTFRF